MSLFPSVFGRNHPGALKGEIDRVFDDFFAGFPAMAGFAAGDNGYMPALDLKETKEGLELTADLPDMKKEDINLEVQQDRLVLSGMRKQEQESTTDEGFHVRERRSGSFRRGVALPFAISDNADVVARYDNGVLRVLIPRPANPVDNTQRVSIS